MNEHAEAGFTESAHPFPKRNDVSNRKRPLTKSKRENSPKIISYFNDDVTRL